MIMIDHLLTIPWLFDSLNDKAPEDFVTQTIKVSNWAVLLKKNNSKTTEDHGIPMDLNLMVQNCYRFLLT